MLEHDTKLTARNQGCTHLIKIPPMYLTILDHAANLFYCQNLDLSTPDLTNPPMNILEQRLAALEGGPCKVVTA